MGVKNSKIWWGGRVILCYKLYIPKLTPSPPSRSFLQRKSEKTSSDSAKELDSWVVEEAFGFCDNYGLNKVICETTIHAQCSCTGKLKHSLHKSFMKPTLILECSAQSSGCNIGRAKAINLTRATTLKYKQKLFQCSTASARLIGAAFQCGLSMKQFKRAVRQAGLKVSNDKTQAVIDSYSTAIHNEYTKQQNCINQAYSLGRKTRVGIDTSFSQNRNAHFSQTAALEENSGEIVQMVITNKHKENCSSNKLEVLGTETLLDKSLAASVPFAAVSTDQCTEVGLLLQRNSVKQLEKLGLAIKIQNDAFHRLKTKNKQEMLYSKTQKLARRKYHTNSKI